MSDWIEWNCGKCPVGGFEYVEVRYRNGEVEANQARIFRWEQYENEYDIVAYRIVKEEPQTFNKPEAVKGFNASGSKYLRSINTIGGNVDVYAVLEAFAVTCPARQHAIKKLLCAGLRGKGDSVQDLKEAADAVDRAVQMEEARVSTT